MSDIGISGYELGILSEVLRFCETSEQPYIHDYELKDLPCGKSPAMLREFLQKLHNKSYLQQNEWTANGIPHYWWQLTEKAMEVLQGVSSKPLIEQASSKPNWISALNDLQLRSVLDEVYRARENGFLMLPLMGARTAFDWAMFLKVGDAGGFDKKLLKMREEGWLNDRSCEILKPMIEAGNATVHRGWIPSRPILDAVIDEIEHQLRDWFIREDASLHVSRATPKRQPLGRPKSRE